MSSTKPKGSPEKPFFLVDCNSFFVSCERVFNPKVRDKPAVVLSNNDGCVIARSNEAKAMGIPMGEPAFKIRDLLSNVAVFSSNFSLYGDLSHRVMQVLAQFTPDIEIYSIDEAFLQVSCEDPLSLAATIKARVMQWTGIPVSVGIAPTKTLAKVANHKAKKLPAGIFEYTTPQHLKKVPVDDIWGIGRRLNKRLASHAIRTAWDLYSSSAEHIRKHFSVVVAKTVLELQGTSCLPLTQVQEPRKSITCSRSFGKKVTSLDHLFEAVSHYIARAAKKLRRDDLSARFVQVYLISETYDSAQTTLELPTNYTPTLITAAKALTSRLYREGVRYKKAGILLLELSSPIQQDLFAAEPQKAREAMHTMDALKKKIQFAAEGIEKPWQMKHEHSSPHYTTCWEELLTI